MTFKEFEEKISRMYYDRNYWINSRSYKSEAQLEAWKYSLEILDLVRKMLRTVSFPENGEISTSEQEKAAQGCTGLCRAKKKDDPDSAWYVGEAVVLDDRAFVLVDDEIRMQEDGTAKIGKWIEADPETVQRYTGKEDTQGNKLFEGDVIQSLISKTVKMEICYGRYGAYCPYDREYMENIGFFVVANTTDDAMPLGPTENYALLLGNVVDNPEIKVV